MKRFFLFVIAMLVIISVMPVIGSDSDFEIDENGFLKKYHGPGGNVTIPSTVKTIESWAFGYNNKIINVTIPSSVTTIESYAFLECKV